MMNISIFFGVGQARRQIFCLTAIASVPLVLTVDI